MITKELIEARIAGLKEKQAEALNTAQALEGAIQDCGYWLEQLKENDKKES